MFNRLKIQKREVYLNIFTNSFKAQLWCEELYISTDRYEVRLSDYHMVLTSLELSINESETQGWVHIYDDIDFIGRHYGGY